jgi:hypothetical protein
MTIQGGLRSLFPKKWGTETDSPRHRLLIFGCRESASVGLKKDDLSGRRARRAFTHTQHFRYHSIYILYILFTNVAPNYPDIFW